MRAVALRGLAARKLRAVLTAVAVVIGVAMISGTFVLTDTIDRAFSQIFEQADRNTDVAIVPHQALDQSLQGGSSEGAPIPASLLRRVRATDGVRTAVGGVFDEASIRDKHGKRIGVGGTPNFVASRLQPPFEAFHPIRGRMPRNAGELALDSVTAKQHDFHLGERITVAGHEPAKRYTISGIVKFGQSGSLGGAAVAVMTPPEAQRVLGLRGHFTEIDVAASPGVSAAALKQRLRAALPHSVDVRTGEENAAKQASSISEGLSFIRTALLVFGAIALFVGAFIIYNTFSITLAQRTRELALLRTLGASRRQVLRSVAIEALAIGALASALGMLLGLGLAPGLLAVFKAVGFTLPQTGAVVLARTVIVALAAGIAVTLLASLGPALRATRVPPVLALSESAVPPRPGRAVTRLRAALAAAFALAGVVLIVAGSAVGALLVLVAVALATARLVPPLARALGWPVERMGGIAGRLARENAVRNPSRTAVTAAALMIGLALVSFVAIFGAGAKRSVYDAIDKNLRASFFVSNGDGFNPIPAGAARAVARVPGVAVVSEMRSSQAAVDGVSGTVRVDGVDPGTLARVYRLEWKRGSPATLGRLGSGSAIVDRKWASGHGIAVGSELHALTPTGKRETYRVIGSFRDPGGLVSGGFVVSNDVIARDFGVTQDVQALVDAAPGSSLAAVHRAADALLTRSFPTAEIQTHAQLKKQQGDQFDQLLTLIYALLSLSVIVSLFGIVNTLVLSVHERTRELGMLRAIGTSRRQVRRMVRLEAVITALIGALLGIALGIVFAVALGRSLSDEGFVLSFPVPTLVLLVVLAALAGVLAAIPPARRASRIDVLRALAYE